MTKPQASKRIARILLKLISKGEIDLKGKVTEAGKAQARLVEIFLTRGVQP